MFKHLSKLPIQTKQMVRVIRYIHKIYPELDLDEWWNAVSYRIYYTMTYNGHSIGVLYPDKHSDNVIFLLRTSLEFHPEDYQLENKISSMVGALILTWLECVPLLHLEDPYKAILFKIGREDIPSV